MATKNVLTAVATLAVIAIATAWLVRNGDAPPRPTTTEVGAHTVHGATSAATPGPHEERPLPADRVDASPSAPSTRPVPSDAPRVAIRAIDGATRAPIVGASVHWIDDSSHDDLDRAIGRSDMDRRLLRMDTPAFAEHFGWRTTTGADGKATVTRNGWLTVAVAKDGWYGELHVEPWLLAPADGFVVELATDRRIVVQVVDDHGRPAPGVLVGVYPRVREGATSLPGPWDAHARTGVDGVAVVEHVQDVAPPREGRTGVWQWRVFALPLAPDDFGVEVSLEAPPREPVVLRLPTCGRVVVAAEINGVPAPGLAWAGLRDAETAVTAAVGDASGDANGRIRIDRVPIGRRYVASTNLEALATPECVGPTARDQEVVVRIVPVADRVLVQARILFAPDEPARERDIAIAYHGSATNGRHTTRTDHDGRFLVRLYPSTAGDGVQRIMFAATTADGRLRQAEFDAPNLKIGCNDFGNVHLTDGKLVCAGRFVEAGGPPRRPIEFTIECFATWPRETEPSWDEALGLAFHQDADGNFRVVGTPPRGEFRLVVDPAAHAPREPVPFVLGAADLAIEVETTHGLAASVLVPAGSPNSAITAEAVPRDRRSGRIGAERDDADEAERERTNCNAADTDRDERRSLHWRALRAGTYDLVIRTWLHAEPLVTIHDVTVPVAADGDRRLEDIDLRPLSRLLAVRVLRSDGEVDAEAGGVLLAAGQPAGTRWRGFAFRSPEFDVLVPKHPVDLVLACRNRPVCSCRADGDRLDVRLQAWPTVPITIADVPSLPDGVRLVVMLEAVDRCEIATCDQDRAIDSIARNDLPHTWVEVVDGRAAVPIGDGVHRLLVALRHIDRRMRLVHEVAAHATAPTTPPTVRIPPEQWELSIRAMLQRADGEGSRPQNR